MRHHLTTISHGLRTEKCLTVLNVFPDKVCYLNLPEDMIYNNPPDMENIKELQDADDALLQHANKYAEQYTRKQIGTVDDILCYVKPGDPPNNWKIALPKNLLFDQFQGKLCNEQMEIVQ